MSRLRHLLKRCQLTICLDGSARRIAVKVGSHWRTGCVLVPCDGSSLDTQSPYLTADESFDMTELQRRVEQVALDLTFFRT